ncbi:MAG: LysM peptidoglycan-binding domain-containing protein [Planctomycetota bacterium]
MRQLISYLAALLVGVGIGYGVGMMTSKPKLEEKQTMVNDLLAQKKKSEEEAQKAIEKVALEAIQYKNRLTRNEALLDDIKKQLKQAKADLIAVKNESMQSAVAEVSESPATPPVSTDTAAPPATIATKEYTVAEDDSLWKIAEKELGNGIRFKEIIDLNPGVTESTVLHKGMKLKIPAQ